MREPTDDLTVVGRLLVGADGWTDVTASDVPVPWRSLFDLDGAALDAEASALVATAAATVSVIGSPDSLVGRVVARHLDQLHDEGVYVDAPDLAVDAATDDVDPFGDDLVGELASAAAGVGVDVRPDAVVIAISDPFFDVVDRTAADVIADLPDPGDVAKGELAAENAVVDELGDDGLLDDGLLDDGLLDDIVGRIDSPLRVASHDPFDAVVPADAVPVDGPADLTPADELPIDPVEVPPLEAFDLTDLAPPVVPLHDPSTDDLDDVDGAGFDADEVGG